MTFRFLSHRKLSVFNDSFSVYQDSLDISLEGFSLIWGPAAFALLVFGSYDKFFVDVEYDKVCLVAAFDLTSLEPIDF